MKKIILLALITLSASTIQSQDMLGVVSSDYSGVSRAFINPASMMNSRKYFDLLLVSGDIFTQNNYLYVPGNDYSLVKLRYLDFPTYPESGQMFLDDYTNRQDKYGYANLRLTGPSAMLMINRQAFAIHNSFRSISSVDGLPYDIAKFMLEGLDYAPQQNIRYTHDNIYTVGSMSWVELGLTYARSLFKQGDVDLSIGATVKRLWAYHGVIVSSTNTDYMTPDSDTLIIYNLNATGGMSAPFNYSDNEFTGLQNPVRGKGFAFDLGVSYVRTLEAQSTKRRGNLCSYPYEPFLFRVGVSLMDFGVVNFDRNVRRLIFDNVDTVWGGINSLQFSFIDVLLGDISQSITGSPDALLQGSSFSMALPSYLSFQFDYNFQNHFIVNVAVVQDIPLLNNRLPRPSYASIAPRYSTDRFEVTLPFSFYRYKEPRIGASLRFLNFSVGSEKLGSLLGFNDFDGLDLYFAIQFGLTKGNCNRRFGAMQNCHAYH